jgi:hypothetical protein
MTKASAFRWAHDYAKDYQANVRYPLHERKHKSYAQAFAYGLRAFYQVQRQARPDERNNIWSRIAA